MPNVYCDGSFNVGLVEFMSNGLRAIISECSSCFPASSRKSRYLLIADAVAGQVD